MDRKNTGVEWLWAQYDKHCAEIKRLNAKIDLLEAGSVKPYRSRFGQARGVLVEINALVTSYLEDVK